MLKVTYDASARASATERSDTKAKRLAICGECEHRVQYFKMAVCGVCKCNLSMKASISGAKCPIGKW